MKRLSFLAPAFSLAETLVATAVFGLVAAAIAVATASLIRNFAFTEDYGIGQSSMNRVLDYLSMDLRSGQGVAFNGLAFTSGTQTLGIGQELTIERPGFYSTSDERDPATYPLIAAGRGVVYGTSASMAPVQKVVYTRMQTPSGEDIITRNGQPIAQLATNLVVRVTAASNGREFLLNASYFSNQRRSTVAQIRSDSQVMMRNPRTDLIKP